MLTKKNSAGYLSRIPGIDQKTLVYGEKTLMVEFRLKKGYPLPRHAHPYEQTGYLVSGRMILTIGDTPQECREGDSWCIAQNVEHSADILEDTVAIEVFSPVREDFLPGK